MNHRRALTKRPFGKNRISITALAALGVLPIACGSFSPDPGSGSPDASGADSGLAGGSSGAGSGASSGSSSGASTGGSSGSSGGAGAACTSVTPCGGNVVGTWNATSSCLKVSGSLDLSNFGLACSVSVTGSLQTTGTWTANADGTYSDHTTTSGTEQLGLPPACLNISGTTTTCVAIGAPLQALGYATIDCANAAGGGCTCAATVQQSGGMGLVTVGAATAGTYTTSNNVLTTSDGAKYAYCVSGNTATFTPQSTGPTTTGSVSFQKSASGSSSSSSSGSSSSSSGGTASSSSSSGGSSSSSSSSSSGGSSSSSSSGGTTSTTGPCDLYATGNTPCVAAYSTVRVLRSAYSGPLYQVRRADGTTRDIAALTPGGVAASANQDTFCGTSACTVSVLYDQSGRGNNLTKAPAGCYIGTASMPDNESNATARSLTVGGHKVYALYMVPQDGYRNNVTSGMPTGNAAQGVYEVADGTRGGPACCWDFGNASTNNCNGGTGLMNAMFFGTGFWGKGAGAGPWFMGDFEAGVWSGGTGVSTTTNASLPSSIVPYAMGVLKTDATTYTIRVGNAQSGTLTTAYSGNTPTSLRWAMQGGIVLGIGGDNSNSSFGTFFEGAITAGRPSDATDNAVQANLIAAGYGK